MVQEEPSIKDSSLYKIEMKASVGHNYSKLDKRHEYFFDAENKWSWFEMGRYINDRILLYPYFPSYFKGRRYTYESDEAQLLGRKCAKKINSLFNKYGK